jgi:hypothetical protein
MDNVRWFFGLPLKSGSGLQPLLLRLATFLMLSATGRFSGIVPPRSGMVLWTLRPTSVLIRLAT